MESWKAFKVSGQKCGYKEEEEEEVGFLGLTEGLGVLFGWAGLVWTGFLGFSV